MSFQFTAMTLTFGQWRHVYFTEKNKKLELMLMRHVKAYSSSCSQTVSLSPAILSHFILGVHSFTIVWCPCAQIFLNLENRDLHHRNLRLMLKILYAAFPSLSQSILVQFALEMCLAARNRQKIHKTPILVFKVIQGHWIGRQSRASVRVPIRD